MASQFQLPATSAALTTAITQWNNCLSGAAMTAAQAAAATAQATPTPANLQAAQTAWNLAQISVCKDALVQAFVDNEVARRVALEAAIMNS